MNTKSTTLTLSLFGVVLSTGGVVITANAEMYKCQTSRGIEYQQIPCSTSSENKEIQGNVVVLPRIIKENNNQDKNLDKNRHSLKNEEELKLKSNNSKLDTSKQDRNSVAQIRINELLNKKEEPAKQEEALSFDEFIKSTEQTFLNCANFIDNRHPQFFHPFSEVYAENLPTICRNWGKNSRDNFKKAVITTFKLEERCLDNDYMHNIPDLIYGIYAFKTGMIESNETLIMDNRKVDLAYFEEKLKSELLRLREFSQTYCTKDWNTISTILDKTGDAIYQVLEKIARDRKQQIEITTRNENERVRSEIERTEKRNQSLINGTLSPEDISDAAIAMQAEQDDSIIIQPQEQPDNKTRLISGSLKQVNGDSYLVNYSRSDYFLVKQTAATKRTNGTDVRINGRFTVIGKYIANQQVKTIGGETKTMPLIQALWIEGQ